MTRSRWQAISSACRPLARASPGRRGSRPRGRRRPAARSGSRPSAERGVPVAAGAGGSRLLFRCTRSIRPVIARTSSTTVARSQPAAQAWQVSSTKPGAELADRLPEPGDGVEVAGHRVAAAGGVLDEQRQRRSRRPRLVGEGLAPVVDADGGVVLGQHVAAVHDQAAARRSPRRPAACCGEQLAARGCGSGCSSTPR